MARSILHSTIAAGLALGALAWAVPAAPAEEAPLTRAPDGRRLVLTFSSDFNRFSREEVGQLFRGGGSGRVQR